MIEDQIEEGVFLETPHFSVIEAAAVNLGKSIEQAGSGTSDLCQREVRLFLSATRDGFRG